MALKTFNVDEGVYAKYMKTCKEHGISMSKQVETFMRAQTEEEPKVREEYLQRLEAIRKGKFIRVDDFAQRYK
jgi:hypothetical protein